MSSAKHTAIWDFELRQLLLPKLGNELSECEDVIAVDTQTCRFAVADGATEAFDAKRWAERLAQHWVGNEPELNIDSFRDWVAAEGRELHDSWNGLTLSWYSEEKARKGSFAAFVGMELDLKTDTPGWKAIALGDACLVHCRGRALLKSLPLADSQSFNSTPVLVASDPSLHNGSMLSATIADGLCEKGDVLLLLSDALACWYLQNLETGEVDGGTLLGTKSDDELSEFFDIERGAGRIRNDDLALVRIEITRRKS